MDEKSVQDLISFFIEFK